MHRWRLLAAVLLFVGFLGSSPNRLGFFVLHYRRHQSRQPFVFRDNLQRFIPMRWLNLILFTVTAILSGFSQLIAKGSHDVESPPSSEGLLLLTSPLSSSEERSTFRQGGAEEILSNGGTVKFGEGRPSITQRKSSPLKKLSARSLGILSISDPGAIAAGAYHVVALKTDGTVWAWGENSSSQLGGSVLAASQARPEQVVIAGSATPTAISAGGFHTLVLMDDGTVVAFGDNSNGQLGNGGTGNGPVAVSVLTDVTAVSAGGYHSLALKSDGTVWVWGVNTNGQLGTGTSIETVPVQIPGLTGIVAIGAGSFTSYAVKGDGTAVAWGANGSGQLGDGSYTDQPAPVAVDSLTDVVAISGGWDHAAALKSDGTVWCWGDNWSGQLGDWYFGGSGTPIQAYGIANAVGIATGSNHTIAKLSDGSMWSWGGNFNGQLGNGEAWVSFLNFDPVPSMLESGVAQVTAGGYTTYALRDDGTVSGFGYVEYGQMGDGQWQGKPYPVQVHGLTGGASAAGGLFHSVVALSDGQAGWFGFYNTQNLFIGGPDPDDQTYQIKMLSELGGVIQVASGDDHTLALLSNGTVWAWGIGGAGQLGLGDNNTTMTPMQITTLSDVVHVAAGGYSSLAVKSDGTIWTWGANDFSQLGDGTATARNAPAQLIDISDVETAVLGADHAVAVKKDGSVWVWGNNDQGQLRAGAAAIISVPVYVPGLYDVEELAAGSGFTLARKIDDSIVAWGLNAFGQLGVGDWLNKSSPTTVSLSGVKDIAAGTRHSLARLADGTVWAWGNNSMGQLGDGTFVDKNSPVAVLNLSAVERVGAAFLHSLAVKQDGSVWSWGNNGNEQLGISVRNEHRPSLRLMPDPADTDGDGILDAWELAHFGTLSRDGTSDLDGDGLSDIQEHVLGTNPTLLDTDGDGFTDIGDDDPLDFYNGTTPVIEVVSGDAQHAPTSTLLPNTLVVRVKSATGPPFANAPVHLEMTAGNARFGFSETDTQSAPASVRTDANGLVTIWARSADEPGSSELTATAVGSTQFVTLSIETDPIVATPILRPTPGSYVFNQIVTISDDTPGSAIHFAFEDREILETDGQLANGDGFLLAGGAYIKVRAFKAGLTPSPSIGGGYGLIGHAESGADHWLVARANGTVWSAGQNDRGQLGDGTATARAQLRAVPGLTGVVAVAAGKKFSLALRGGAVWAWGANDQGQLGDGTTTDRATPAAVPGMDNVVVMHAGDAFAIAMKWDGSIWTWGANDRGQLGDGTTVASSVPIQVAGVSSTATVSAGKNFALVMENVGTVKAWGANDRGQLGDGTTTDRHTPVSIVGLTNIYSIVGGDAHALAASGDGVVWSWGANDQGQLGDGSTTDRLSPGAVSSVTEAQWLSAVGNYSLALTWDGLLHGWGANDWRQLQSSPVASLPNPHVLTAVNGLIFTEGGGSSVVGIQSDGTIMTWGANGVQSRGNLHDSDVDGDGVADAWEVEHGLDPASTDTDGDGMPDNWEVEHGLDALADDRFDDYDGDGIPNHFEYLHGSAPDDDQSIPTAILIVDPSDSNAYQTIQAAINAASPNDIIQIASGTYSGSGNRGLYSGGKSVLLIGAGGSSSVTIDCEANYNGISTNTDISLVGITFLRPYQYGVSASGGYTVLRDIRIRETVYASGRAITLNNVSGIIEDVVVEDGKSGGLYANASQLKVTHYDYVGNTSTGSYGALYIQGESSLRLNAARFESNQLSSQLLTFYGNSVQVNVTNAVILRNRTTAQYLVYNYQASTSFNHSTLANNQSAGASYGHIYLSGNAFSAQNSIFYNDAAKPEFYSAVPTLSHVIVRGGGAGTSVLDIDPKLTATAHLQYDSPAIDAGVAIAGMESDIDGESRPEGAAADIGADEWLADGTHAQLPAWFVTLYNLGSSTGDADGDGLSDVAEYLAGTNPTLVDTDGDGVSDDVEVGAGLNPLSGDSDGDGMPDGWEVTYGLNPALDDSFADLDGDGFPNLFEYLHGSSPDDDQATPSAQRHVNPSDPGAHATIQAAINAAAAYDIISIAPGTYTGNGNRDLYSNDKPVLLLGSGSGSVTLDSEGAGYNGISTNTDLALVGITFLRPYQYAVSANDCRVFLRDIQVSQTTYTWGDAITLNSVLGNFQDVLVEKGKNGGIYATASRLTVSNFTYRGNNAIGGSGGLYVSDASTIVLNGAHFTDNQMATQLVTFYGNTVQASVANTVMLRNRTTAQYLLYNEQASTSFKHSTLAHNQSAGTSYGHVYLSGATFSAQNSIFYNDSAKPEFYNTAPTLSHVIVRGGGTGTSVLNVDPKLTASGHLQYDSPAIDAGLAITGAEWDIDGESRPEGAASDIGADEWIADGTHLQLPAWFVSRYNLAASTGDADGDGLSDLGEYLAGTNPSSSDTDGDGIDDGAEVIAGTDPLSADSDGDGLPDGWEVTYGLNPALDDSFADLDGDGFPNLFEYLHGSSPDDDQATPSAQRHVNPSDPGAHATIQAAINAAAAYDIISIAPGTYTGSGNRDLYSNDKPVLLLGSSGSGSVTLDSEGAGYNGISTNTDLALVGITFLRPYQYAVSANGGRIFLRDIQVSQTTYTSGSAITLSSVRGYLEDILIERGKNGGISANSSQLGIVNFSYRRNNSTGGNGALYVNGTGTIVLDGARFTDNKLTTQLVTFYGSAVQASVINTVMLRNRTTAQYLMYNEQAVTSFNHSAFAHNQSAGTSYGHIYLSGATFSAQNSIFHDDSAKPEFYGTAPTLSHVIVRGGATGTSVLNVDPKLTTSGHLQYDSPAIDAGLSLVGLDQDLDDESRPAGSSPDIGADEWIADTTHPQLPAWFVDRYNLVASTGDADGDGLSDLDEYLAGTNPALADTDGDGLSDSDELLAGTDPLYADTDDDGMSDGWEVAHGLDPLLYDAFADLDGDGVPNLFEYIHGTLPDDVLSLPSAQRRVDPSDPGSYATIQAAINAAAAYDVIEIAPGTYSGSGNRALSTSKPISLQGEGGSAQVILNLQGSTGISANNVGLSVVGVTFLQPSQNALSMSNGFLYARDIRIEQATSATSQAIYLSTVKGVLADVSIKNGGNAGIYATASEITVDGFVYEGNTTTSSYGALYLRTASKLVLRNAILTGNFTANQLLTLTDTGTQGDIANTLISRNRTSANYLVYAGYSTTQLRHVTAYSNRAEGTSSTEGYIRVDGGSLSIQNSILYNLAGRPELSGTAPTLSHVIVRGGGSGTSVQDVDPLLTAYGRIRPTSPAIDAALTLSGLPLDLDSESRLTDAAPDLGADEWVADTIFSQLPAWFVSQYGLGGSSGDADSDGLSDLDEYFHGSDPTVADTDGDGLTDGQEVTLGSNPLLIDSDGDGMPDAWEDARGLNPALDDAFADLDGDRIPNIFEYKHGWKPDDFGKILDSSNVVSSPPAVYEVDAALAADLPETFKYRTIQGAINAARQSSYVNGAYVYLNRYAIIEVKSGRYDVAQVSTVELLLLGEASATGEIPEIRGTSGQYALRLESPSVVDGFLISRARSDYGTGVYAYAASGSNRQRRVVNTIIRDHRDSSYGAIYNNAADLRLIHTTVTGNSGYYANGAYLTGTGASLTITNSILWNADGNAAIEIYPASSTAVQVVDSIVTDGQFGGLDNDPLLTGQGLLRTGSAAINAATTAPALRDIHGEVRPSGSASDLGADEFVDTNTNGLPDWLEAAGITNPTGDGDGDGLNNLDEYLQGTRPDLADTDGDGWSDGDEVAGGGNPLDTDTDGDGMPDGWEVDYGYDPTVSDAPGSSVDTDGDGLTNVQEAARGTNPNSGDTDGDGMPDGWEVSYGLNPLVNDASLDKDRDGLSNLLEYQAGTRPDYFDTDGDLLPDGFEYYSAYLDPLVPNGLHDDFDGDGLTTFEEMSHGTNPDLIDTDGDGISDFDEIEAGSDPLDALSKPFNPSDFVGAPINDTNAYPIGDLGVFYNNDPAKFRAEGRIGDESGSYSERWKLQIGPKSAVSQNFGQVDSFNLKLIGKTIYPVTLEHVASNLSTPDYDYVAEIEPEGFLLSDTQNLLGSVGDDETWRDKTAYLAPIKSLGYSESYSGGDAVGPRYRKVSLDGRPLSDEKPEEEAETEVHKEETYIDAFDLSLHHDTSYIYTPLAASELTLEASASVRETSWTNRGGLRPHEELTSPFGIAWSSNLTAYIEVVQTLGDNTPDPITVNVVDEGGRSQRFGTENLESFFPWPSSRVDKKTFLNRLVKDGNDLVLYKKYGNKLTYRPSKAWFMYSSDRIEGSEKVRKHVYWRLEKVEDKYGNALHYDYGTAEVSLIPERIYSNNRMGQRLHITRSADSRRILSITDARGSTVTFNYSVGTAGSVGDGISYPYTRLDSVSYPDGTTQSYGYQIVSDVETVDDQVTRHYHANISSITDKRGNTYAFNYQFDRTKQYYSGNNGRCVFGAPITGLPGDVQADLESQLEEINSEGGSGSSGYKTQYGLSRLVSSVSLPGGIHTATFAKTSNTSIKYGPQFSATSGTTVTDAEGNTTAYDFTGVQGEVIDRDETAGGNDGGASFSVSIEWMIYYSTMVIHHGALEGQSGHLGKETFEYDLASGLSLKRMTDMSGNVTTWTFGEALPGGPVVKLDQTSNFMSAWADPTSKTDALDRTETYTYGTHRVMTSSVDVHGTTTTTAVDSLGRRKSLVVTDANAVKLSEETYLYDDEDGDPFTSFASFMVEKRVKAFANHSGQPWEQDLVTKYVPDTRGRIQREIVDPSGLALVTEYTYDLNNNKVTTTDPRGHTTTFTYDALNRLVATTYPAAGTSAGNLPAKVRTLYDANGNTALEIDEEGRHVIHHHDERNRLLRTIVDMDTAGLPTVPDASQPQLLLEHNRGTVTADDLVTAFTYNAVGATLTETNPRGYVKRSFYDALQRLRHVYTHYQSGDANSDGTENGSAVANSSEKTHVEYLYQPARNPGAGAFSSEAWKPTQVINHGGVHTKTGVQTLNSHFYYDDVYRETEKQVEYEPSLFSSTTTAYGAITSGKEALVTTATDARGKITRTYRDGLDRVVTVQDAVGTASQTETHTSYSSTGMSWLSEDALGRLTETEYDRAGRPVKVWSPDPITGLINRQLPGDTAAGSPLIETVYDDAGNVVASINPRGLRWDYTFDARNRKTHEQAPSTVDAATSGSPSVRGLRTTHFDGVGNAIENVDPRGASTTTDYDRANRPVTVTSTPVAVYGLVGTHELVTTTTYDKAGNAILIEDQAGNRTVNFYDALNRVVAVATNPVTGAPSQTWGSPATDDIRVVYGYDDAGNRTLVTDGEGAQTGLRYDGLVRNTQTIWDIGQSLQRTKTSVYDGQVLVSRTDEKGQVTQYGYDDLHRLTSITYVGRTVDNRAQTYDAVGNLLTVSYPNDSGSPRAIAQTFDALNRVASETSAGVTHAYTYDRAGNRLTTTYGQTGRAITSTYDGLERLSEMSETDGVTTHVTAYHYDLNGNIVGHELANGVVVARTFDALNRTTAVSNTASGAAQPFTALAYQYDEMGNMREIAETYPAGNLPNRTVTNTYDRKYRLTAEAADTSGSGTVTTAYGYDDADNRASKTVTGGSAAGTTTYAYGDGTTGTGANSNQLIGYTAPGSVVVTYTYDANGNRATKVQGGQTDTYSYDYENRLLSLDYQTGGSDTGLYAYGYDHRTRRVVRNESAITGRDLSLVVFSGGTSVQEHTTALSSSPDVEYVRGSDYGGGIGGLLYSVRSTGPQFNHYNSRGDVIAKTDDAGVLTYEGQYEAFGKRTEEVGTNIDRQTANTKDEDPHGLLNEGMRYRDLETGTYITRDPAGFVDGPNVYTYVVQNPWTKFDQEGQFWSALVTVGFAALDTYQYATGQISGKEYAANMAINAVSLAADAATGGMGGGIAVRTAAVAARAGKAGTAAVKAVVAADKAINTVQKVDSVIENGAAAVEAAKEGRIGDALVATGNAAMSAKGGSSAGSKSSKITQAESKLVAETKEAVSKKPNPYGKKGGPAHQAKVDQVEADVRARGLEPSREHMIETPGGEKGKRFVDVVGKDSQGNVVEMHQIGKQTKGGNPVARETRALNDIEAVKQQRPKFHPYNE